jgi:hypothetical protein
LAEATLESVPGGVPSDLLRNRSTLYSKVAEFREDSEYAICFVIIVAEQKSSSRRGVACFSRLYGSDMQTLHWNSCQEVFQATCSEIGRLYTQKLQNFERIMNMLSVSSLE